MESRGDAGSREEGAPTVGGISRRRFGQVAMIGLAGGAMMPAELLKVGAPARPPDAALQQHGGRPLPAGARKEVEDKLRRIFAEYGDRLSESQKQRMRGIVAYHVQMLDTVRAIPLANADAPATVLKLVTGSQEERPPWR